ncbi:MAG: HD domain-containing protein [Actinomycetes bacterium]
MLLARPLTAAELEEVRGWLDGSLLELFLAQQVADQRHGYAIARSVLDTGHRMELVVAAALHDVGKARSRLGAFRRSIVTVLMVLRVPLKGRWLAYAEHGKVGAEDLEKAGAPPLVVSFARHHQHGRPPDIAPEDWSVLNRADLGTLTGRRA